MRNESVLRAKNINNNIMMSGFKTNTKFSQNIIIRHFFYNYNIYFYVCI